VGRFPQYKIMQLREEHWEILKGVGVMTKCKRLMRRTAKVMELV